MIWRHQSSQKLVLLKPEECIQLNLTKIGTCVFSKKTCLCFSPLVARSTVTLSVRRHSTAAALAQNATLETQENRWFCHTACFPTGFYCHRSKDARELGACKWSGYFRVDQAEVNTVTVLRCCPDCFAAGTTSKCILLLLPAATSSINNKNLNKCLENKNSMLFFLWGVNGLNLNHWSESALPAGNLRRASWCWTWGAQRSWRTFTTSCCGSSWTRTWCSFLCRSTHGRLTCQLNSECFHLRFTAVESKIRRKLIESWITACWRMIIFQHLDSASAIPVNQRNPEWGWPTRFITLSTRMRDII